MYNKATNSCNAYDEENRESATEKSTGMPTVEFQFGFKHCREI